MMDASNTPASATLPSGGRALGPFADNVQVREGNVDTRVCTACGANIPDGPCPHCLLRIGLRGLDSEEDLRDFSEPGLMGPPSSVPSQFGGYQIIEKIAQGGMGVVYRARQVALKKDVALKVLRAGELAGDTEKLLFCAEARAAARLDHPNIVRLHEFGENEGRSYFTMELMEGGPLSKRLGVYREDQRMAARLVETLARAVHHGHQRRIIHRDLKPDNILFDARGIPHVADFGVAKHLEEVGGTVSGAIVGTVRYMAPEQAKGASDKLTTVADVYSLGVILYELITGQVPFSAPLVPQLLRQVIEDEPPAPRSLDARIDRDLESICLKCLRKEPEHRYGSAEELAQDLGRYRRNELIKGDKSRWPARLMLAARRNPVPAGAAAGALCVLLAVILGSLSVARSREAALLREVQQSNAWSARLVAVNYLYQLEKLGQSVAKLAADPEASRVLADRDADGAQAFLDAAKEGWDEVDNLMLLDAAGRPIARFPHLTDLASRDFSYRDYFKGALRYAGTRGLDSIHVSRVFQSTVDGRTKFSLSAPIWDGDPGSPRLLGVLSVDWTTSSRIGLFTRLSDGGRESVMAGREESDGPAGQPRYQILFHPAYHDRDSSVGLRSDRIKALIAPDPREPELRLPTGGSLVDRAPVEQDEYIDPVAEQRGDRSRYLAAFAPVGNTDLVAIVQQRYDLAIEPNKTLASRLTWWAALAFSLGAGLAALAAIYDRRRAARRRRLGR